MDVVPPREGATVLGHAESVEAAEAEARRRALPPPPAPRLTDDPHRRSLMDLHQHLFPPPLTEAEVEEWCRAVDLGPEAIELARSLVEIYSSRLRAFPSGESLSLVVSSFQWSETGDRLVPLWTPVHMAMLVRRRDYLDALRGAEGQLFAALLPLVTPQRQLEARRRLFHRNFQLEAPGEPETLAGIDPIALLSEMKFEPEELAPTLQALDLYVRDAEPVLRRRRAASLQRDLEQAQLRMGLGPFWELTVPAHERTALTWELDSLRGRRNDLDGPLRALTRTLLLSIAELLPPKPAVAFMDRLAMRFPPAAFDEERTLAQLLAASLALPELDQGAREGRLGFQAAVRRRLLASGLESVELAELEAALPSAASGDTSLDRAAALERIEVALRRMENMRQRRAICLEAADSLRVLLTAEETALASTIEQFRRELAMRASAETWLVRQYRERASEIRQRAAEEEAAAEEAAIAASATGLEAETPDADDPRRR